jgi:tetratricopeptide (TPR) repeat protein
MLCFFHKVSSAQNDTEYPGVVRKGDSLLQKKKPELAEKEYKKAHALKPEERYPQGKLEEIYAARALNKEHEIVPQRYRLNLPEADPVKTFNKLVTKGDSCVKKHNEPAGTIYYQEALTLHGIPCPARATIYKKLEIPFQCSEQVPPVYTRKADSLMKAGKLQDARVIYHKAVFLYPKDEETRKKVVYLDSLLQYAPVIHIADSLINAGKFLEGYYTYEKARISGSEDSYRDSIEHLSEIYVDWIASMRNHSPCIHVTCACPLQDFRIQILNSREETMYDGFLVGGSPCINWDYPYYALTDTYHWIARYKTNCGGKITEHISNGTIVLVKSIR